MHWSKAKVGNGLPVAGIRSHSASLIKNKIFVLGGCDASDKFNDVAILDTDIQHWYFPTVSGEKRGNFRAHTATCVQNDQIFVFGGGDGPNYFNDLWLFDTVNTSWSKPQTTGKHRPSQRRAHTAEYLDDHIYIFGGGDGKQALNDTYSLNAETLHWSMMKTCGQSPSKRGYHKSVIVGSRMYILGGSNGKECFDDIYGLDLGKIFSFCFLSISLVFLFKQQVVHGA